MAEGGGYLGGVDVDDVGGWGDYYLLLGAQGGELGSVGQAFAVEGEDRGVVACCYVDEGGVGGDEEFQFFDDFAYFEDVAC